MSASQLLLSYFVEAQSKLENLCNNINYQFNDFSLLVTAMTHRSALNELHQKFISPHHRNIINSLPWNEKLEFLGDSVLSLSISTILWNTKRLGSEGDLTLARSALVKESSLLEVAKIYHLESTLIIGNSLNKSQTGVKSSILADALEALFGALYLDSGFDKTTEIIEKMYYSWLGDSFDPALLNDHKSSLQELTQKHFNIVPTYHLIEQTGPDHNKNFVIECRIKGKCVGIGAGPSKKKASQNAALNALSNDFASL